MGFSTSSEAPGSVNINICNFQRAFRLILWILQVTFMNSSPIVLDGHLLSPHLWPGSSPHLLMTLTRESLLV